MKPTPSPVVVRALSGGLFVSLSAMLLLPSCSESAGESSTASARADHRSAAEAAARTAIGTSRETSPSEVTDAPLPEFQTELLELAFQAASALPKDPFLKDRSRAQEAVLETCFELDQPARALAYSEDVDNWRRGVGYAEYAFHCARHGHLDRVDRYLELAEQRAEMVRFEQNPQQWRQDYVLGRVARVLTWMGRREQAAEIERRLEPSQSGLSWILRASQCQAEEFEPLLAELWTFARGGDFDRIARVLEAATELYDRFYEDEPRRARAEELVRRAWPARLPLNLVIESRVALADAAAGHGDADTARSLAAEARELMDQGTWLPENEVPMLAHLAGVHRRAGDVEQARRLLEGARAMFEAARDRIVNIERAETLLPLAAAFDALGDREVALELYREATEESVANPNSRPRAEDLSATCLALARDGVEPDAALRARLHELIGALGAPW